MLRCYFAAAAAACRYVVDVSARSLELLCEDLGSPSKNAEFNKIMHTVLGVAEQVIGHARESCRHRACAPLTGLVGAPCA